MRKFLYWSCLILIVGIGIAFSLPPFAGAAPERLETDRFPQQPGALGGVATDDIDLNGHTISDSAGSVTIDDTLTVNGTILIPDGTLADPSLAFASDPDTGLRLAAPNNLALQAGGSTRIVLSTAVSMYASVNQTALTYQYHSGAEPFLVYDDLAVSGDNSNGAVTLLKTKTESVTFAANPGDASKATVGSIIPTGAFVTNVTSRVVTAATNCTDVDIGIAGTDTDMFADGTAVVDTTTTTNADANTAASWASVTPSVSGAQEITITANGGNCFDGVWAITVHYIDATAATSD